MSDSKDGKLSQDQVKKLEKLLDLINAEDEEAHSEDVEDKEVAKHQKEKRRQRAIQDAKIASSAHLIYTASRIKIYKIASKFEAFKVNEDIKIQNVPRKIEIPERDSWDLKLGDIVRIKYSFEDFKVIQKSTLGWNGKLRTIHGCLSIVTKCRSKYDNQVGIYVPSVMEKYTVYAGVLERAHEMGNDGLDLVPSQWNVGDYVTTKMDDKIINLLQQGLDGIFVGHLGTKGRVIAVTRAGVLVTFDEKESVLLNPYLLIPCVDTDPIEIVPVENPRGFEVGEKVKVISDYKKMVENQKDHGEWSSDMTSMTGKEAIIVDIIDETMVFIRVGHDRSWLVNSASILKDGEEEENPIETGESLMEMGEIVKFSFVSNIRSALGDKNVPLIFLEYLRVTGEISTVDEDLDYFVQYNCDQNISVYASTLVKASDDEKKRHKQIKALEENLKAGSKVFLDVGPPNYVSAILREVHASQASIKALTTSATLVGFADDNRAVIEYEDGSRFKIKKKFLTVPEKFHIREKCESLTLDVAKEIQDNLQLCVQIIHDDNNIKEREHLVQIIFLSHGSPPKIDFRIYTTAASFQQICELLLSVSSWSVNAVCDGVMFVKLSEAHGEIKVSLFFNNEEYEAEKPLAAAQKAEVVSTQTVKTRIAETPAAPAAAAPFTDQRRLPRINGGQGVPASLDFSYMAFADCFIPFVWREHVERPLPQRADNQTSIVINGSGNVNNIFTDNKIDRLNIQ